MELEFTKLTVHEYHYHEKNETKSREQDHEHQKEMASSACANESALVLDNQDDSADNFNC